MDLATVLVVLLVVAVVVLALWVVALYNGLVRLRNLVQESWRQVDVELHRRHDLVPNLVESVKGYAAHERQVLEDVVAARSLAARPGSAVAEQAAQEDALSGALGRLFALAEGYPQLRASENFLGLQRELTDTEDRIAASRRLYNANVRSLNTKVEVVPSTFVASAAGIGRAEYFEVRDPAVRARPDVSFGT